MASRGKRRLLGEINVVPYIDVMLVLLIIFMVTAPLLTQGIEVELPKAAAEPLDPDLMSDNQPLILSVDASGQFYLNVGEDEESPQSASTILDLAAAVIRQKPGTPVLVKADQAVAYGRVVTAMVILQQAGAAKVGFLTDPADLDRALADAGLDDSA
jgi:biopolymer transport protein TolR